MIKRMLKKIKENSFISNSLAYILASFIIKGISFITTPIFTRLMGTADFGITTNFVTWGQLGSILICVLVSSSLMSASANVAKGRLKSYVFHLTIFCICTFACFCIVVIPISNVIARLTKLIPMFIGPLIIYSFGTSMSEFFSAYCIAANKVKTKIIFAIVSSLFFIIGGIVFVVLFQDKAYGRIWGYFASYLVISIFIVIYFLRFGYESDNYWTEDIKYALTFSIPLIPHILANIINGQIDRVFILRKAGEAQVGIYSVAYSVGGLALTFANAATDAWTPWYYIQSRENNLKEIAKYYRLYTITISMCFIGVMFLTPEIMRLMAPHEYLSGASCVSYVALGIFFLFMYRFPLCYEQLLGDTKYVAPATVLAAGLNVFLNMVLIPQYGIKGAAAATSISYAMLWLLHELVARFIFRNYDIRFINSVIPILIVFMAFIAMTLLSLDSFARYGCIGILCILYILYVWIEMRNIPQTKKKYL